MVAGRGARLRLGAIVGVAALGALLLPCAAGSDRAPLGVSPNPAPRAATKRIAITFDDVPRAAGAYLSEDERAQQLIAAMRAAGVDQAAFFVNPARIDARGEARIAAYAAAGHVIGDHGFRHL